MSQMVEQLRDDSLSYTWFDFHGECKKMKWENLSKLIKIVQNELEDWGHFMAELDLPSGMNSRSELN